MSNSLKTIAVIEKIYQYYDSWASGLELACHQGCAACCTRNVTMTQAEGELILRGLHKESRLKWLHEKLRIRGRIGRPAITTNEWAKRCLQGQDVTGDEPEPVLAPCPFLDQQQSCSLYPLRPFSCRCFGSTVDCAQSGMAEQPDMLMEINTVTLQLIEHLGHGKYWGNMLDLLLVLPFQDEACEDIIEGQQVEKRLEYIHRARSMPGFLVMPAQQDAVRDYLTGLFAIKVNGITVGEILNIPL